LCKTESAYFNRPNIAGVDPVVSAGVIRNILCAKQKVVTRPLDHLHRAKKVTVVRSRTIVDQVCRKMGVRPITLIQTWADMQTPVGRDRVEQSALAAGVTKAMLKRAFTAIGIQA
jgi:hypothetical protein